MDVKVLLFVAVCSVRWGIRIKNGMNAIRFIAVFFAIKIEMLALSAAIELKRFRYYPK